MMYASAMSLWGPMICCMYILQPSHFLRPPPSARKLWVNGTTNKLYWGSSDTATDYIVYRATTSGGPYTAVANASTNTTYLDVGLTPGTTYYYVISAQNQIGEGDPSTELSGTAQAFTIFANSDSSWGDNLNNYKEAVFDGDTTTFYDSPDAAGYVGIDLGAGNSLVPSQVAYCPRESYTDRMVGGIFQGSNDGYTWDDLYTVTVTPAVGWNYAYPDTSTAYRYLQFYSDSAYGNVAEIESANIRRRSGMWSLLRMMAQSFPRRQILHSVLRLSSGVRLLIPPGCS